jgi:hypothetical protein
MRKEIEEFIKVELGKIVYHKIHEEGIIHKINDEENLHLDPDEINKGEFYIDSEIDINWRYADEFEGRIIVLRNVTWETVMRVLRQNRQVIISQGWRRIGGLIKDVKIEWYFTKDGDPGISIKSINVVTDYRNLNS